MYFAGAPSFGKSQDYLAILRKNKQATSNMQLIECIPNFSEGQNAITLAAIRKAIQQIDGVQLLHMDQGEAANRTVFTFVGPPKAVIEAAFQAIKVAASHIDMSQQKGEHPRIGATDVCPLVPLQNISMEEVQVYAKQLGKRVGAALNIPIYLYENSASHPDRKNLATIRSGEYEGLAAKMQLPEWQPDYGPSRFNAQSGATVIGARDFLIAYNVNLDTKEVAVANEIARTVRASGRLVQQADGRKKRVSGQLKYVKAIGWYIEEYGQAQVSMNLTNIHQTGVHQAFDACVKAAEKLGVKVTGSELIGLLPEKALLTAGHYYIEKEGRAEKDNRLIIKAAIAHLGLSDLSEFIPEERIIEWIIGG